MAEKIDAIMRFSPGNCAPELLEKMLVGQHELVNSLEKSVWDDIQNGAGRHWLIVGPRGAGKTHLLALLFNRIDKNSAIRDRVVIAYMKEEERGVATLKKSMGRKGQQKFRDLVQQHPFWSIIASTQNLFDDVQKQEAPFYGQFKIHHLQPLTFGQALELLEKLAAAENRDQLKNFLRTPAGQGRIRAIYEITGGSPRLLVIFYQFIDNDALENLSGAFLEMADNLTAYYEEQMQPLPAYEQKILDFLCGHRSPATVKEIAQACFISSQTASKQLERLIDRKFLHRTEVGRQSFYELREPLLRISFELKENQGYPIRLFVDFLGRFYSSEELKKNGYEKALAITSNNGIPHFNIALTWFQSGNFDCAIQQLEHAIRAGEEQNWDAAAIICLNEINTHLLKQVLIDRLPTLIQQQQELFNRSKLAKAFLEGMTAAITDLLKPHQVIPLERLIQLNEKVISMLAQDDQFRVVCRLFDTGVRYLQKNKDLRVLLELPREERSTLQTLLGEAENAA